MGLPRNLLGGLVLVCAVVGCSGSPQHSLTTGSRECVESYFAALVRQDWPAAYALLDPQIQQRYSVRNFTELARHYVQSMGFEPVAATVWACEEHDENATAHVVLTGHAAMKDGRYKDAVTLRRGLDGWRIVLPPNFGQSAKR